MNFDPGQNYFELFVIQQQFHLDPASLAPRYREIQSAVHPDKFANGSDQEKRLSVQTASMANDAFETLKSPLKRALYLLRLKGFEFNEQATAQLDPVFLMQQMTLRETIGEAKHQSDPFDVLDEVSDQVNKSRKEIIEEIRQGFDELPQASLQEIRILTQKLQFFDKLTEEIQIVEAQLEDV
jgi:molecular chaperone HscB